MKIPTIPTQHHKAWRIAGTIFGSLILTLGTIGTIAYADQGFPLEKIYNLTMSYLLAFAMVVPYNKIDGTYRKQIGYGILGLVVFNVITSTIPGAIQDPDFAGIFGALMVGSILIANGLIAYEVLVKRPYLHSKK